jgi:FkbM family methyltransferase
MGILNHESSQASGELHFMQAQVAGRAEGVILDIGANVGNYSTSLRRANPEIPIYAFEPHPVTYSRLCLNVDGLNVKTFNLGAGCVAGSMTLYDYADRDGSSHASMYKGVIEQIHHGRAIGHEVSVIALDDFVAAEKIDLICLLKIDTEGHELEVLKGFRRTIAANKIDMIHFEFNEMNMASRVFFHDFWELLPNYDFFRMLPGGLLPLPRYNPVACEIFAYQNVVALLKQSFRAGARHG